MKRSTASGKNGKFAIIVITCTCRVLQEMLPRIKERCFSLKAYDWLARAGLCASVLRSVSIKNGFRYVLLNPLL